MRLLEAETLSVKEFPGGYVPEYAILSHVWGQDEVTLRDIQESRVEDKKGYAKVRECCKRALKDGFEYVWIDTCCIDKTSSAELSEAINSMYTWYQESDICYAYLADVSSQEEITISRWFTRGWTLQELIAPSTVIFLDQKWEELGTKTSLSDILSSHTGIPKGLLCDDAARDIHEYSVAQKMSWAAGRTTTRVEDRAYSLLGIFGIHMSPIYGEGANAFIRLREEIIRISDDQSLFAWSSGDNRGGLLATSPDAFRFSGKIVPYYPDNDSYTAPYISSRGIHLELLFLPTLEGPGIGIAVLDCRDEDKEEESIAIFVKDTDLLMERFRRTRTSNLNRIKRNVVQTRGSVKKICIRRPHTLGSGVPIPGEFGPDDRRKEFDLTGENTPSISALRKAALKGRGDLVWYLLSFDNVASWSQRRDAAETLLDAIRGGDAAALRVLLVRSGINPRHEDKSSPSLVTPHFILEALKLQHYHIIKLLLERGFTANTVINYATGSISLLSYATLYGLESIVRLLLKHGAEVNWSDTKDRTPLFHAVEKGNKNIVEILLNEGTDVNRLDWKGRTPLSFALEHGHKDIVEILVRKRADVNKLDGKGRRTMLSYAKEKGHEKIARTLIDGGAKMDPSTDGKKVNKLLGQLGWKRASSASS